MFLDRLSRALSGKRAEIEVVSLALGDQIEAEWLPLIGVVYDPKSDLIEIALDGLDHLIRKPEQMEIEGDEAQLSSMKIVDRDGIQQILRFRDPMALPPPH
jgi:hypothetical protein